MTTSPFASRNVPEHLVRGACAAGLATLAVWLLSSAGILGDVAGAVAIVAAVVLLRGCPMCWLAGLYETIAEQIQKAPTHD